MPNLSNDENPTFGQLLTRFRERRGLTQGQLAEAVGYGTAAISRFEADDRSPPPDEVITRIATVLGLEAWETYSLRLTARLARAPLAPPIDLELLIDGVIDLAVESHQTAHELVINLGTLLAEDKLFDIATSTNGGAVEASRILGELLELNPGEVTASLLEHGMEGSDQQEAVVTIWSQASTEALTTLVEQAEELLSDLGASETKMLMDLLASIAESNSDLLNILETRKSSSLARRLRVRRQRAQRQSQPRSAPGP